MIPFIVSLALFMEAVDSTVINTAIPAMANSLHVNPIDLKVALISYLLSLAIFIPISGWIADKFGIKRVFTFALVVFTLSSLLCGYSNNLNELVITRFLQGLGGSMMLPLGRLIIVRTYPRRSLVNIMSRVVMVGAIGMMIGPALGGLITDQLSWRWIFWINIPVGLINIILARLWLTESATKDLHSLDKIGFVLFGSGLAGLTFGLSAISETTIKMTSSLMIILFSIGLLFIYWIHSRKQRNPVVNTKLFAFKTFRIAILGNLFARLSFGGAPFLIPLLLQICLGYSPLASGLLLAPTALGVLTAKPLSLNILRMMGYKQLLLVNTILMGFILWAFTFINHETSIYAIGSLTFIYGFITALQYTGMNSMAYADIEQHHLSAATSITSTMQQISQSFGVAICAILIQFFMFDYNGHSPVTIEALRDTFIVMGILTILSIVIFFNLQPSDGQEMLS
jgi:EmrB/QacA subfamily drug resistance transporter